MPDVHVRRREAAWNRLRVQAPRATALLITSLTNIRYLTGFTGSNAVLLIREGGALLGTDARYALQVAEQSPELSLVLDRNTLAAVTRAWRDEAGTAESSAGDGVVLAVEAAHLSVADLRGIEDIVGGSVVESLGVVEGCRIRKESSEIALLERACEITDAALQAILGRIVIGLSERDVARMLEAEMLALGADAISFPTIVAAGPHSAKPHHEPTSRPLERGDLLLIDFGASVEGYHADETRTFVVGQPAQWQSDIHAVVAAAQGAGREAARAGAELADVDNAARAVVDQAGFGEFFGHGLGHGVGLQIHEAPFLGPRATGRLPAGSPVTIEPGIYLPGRGGVRIEDTILVDEGPSKSLTTSPRDLVIVG
jgi:Xaa-Pro aminopeptidase